MLQTFAAVVEAADGNPPAPIPGFTERLRVAHPSLSLFARAQWFYVREVDLVAGIRALARTIEMPVVPMNARAEKWLSTAWQKATDWRTGRQIGRQFRGIRCDFHT